MIINTTHDYQSKIGSFEVIVERATNSNPNLVTCVFLYVRLVAFFYYEFSLVNDNVKLCSD